MKITNFMIVTEPDDFALLTALYRSSVDGRRYLYEAVLSDDPFYNLPDNFTSRTSEVLQVYLKALGIGMATVDEEEDVLIAEPEDFEEIHEYEISDAVIFCTKNEMYYLRKLAKIYKRYIKDNPGWIDDWDDVLEYLMDNLPFKKKYLTYEIIQIFHDNLEAFGNSVK